MLEVKNNKLENVPFDMEFPFETELDLSHFLNYCIENIKEGKFYPGEFGQKILTSLEGAPELFETITDNSVIEKHKETLEILFSLMMAIGAQELGASAAFKPFTFETLYASQEFFNIMPTNAEVEISNNIVGQEIGKGKLLKCCLSILHHVYNKNVTLSRPLLFNVKDTKTGLMRYYKMVHDERFMKVTPKKGAKELDEQTIEYLLDNHMNVDALLENINVEDYIFSGILFVNFTDITDQEVISSIKNDLLEKNALLKTDTFEKIQNKIKTLFGISDLDVGIAIYNEHKSALTYRSNATWKSIMLDAMDEKECTDYQTSVYGYLEKKRVHIVEDLQAYPNKGKIENNLLQQGVRNLAVASLKSEDEFLGFLELSSPTVGSIDKVNATRLYDILPMFCLAVKRLNEEYENEVKAVIQEQCTSIHPTVEWKFMEAGMRVTDSLSNGEKIPFEPIVFKDVYPLYGLVDVRGSSKARNEAIRSDLMKNLHMVKEVIQSVVRVKPMPILDELSYRIGKKERMLDDGLHAGEESDVTAFLRKEVNPLLTHFKQTDAALKEIIENFEEALNPEFGIVYEKRKAFEDTINIINDTISLFILEAEEKAQQIFPHYFEKYKTDGVEYNLYVGSSLVKDQKFDPVYLKNFRLWQLLNMCEIANRIHDIKELFPLDLEVTFMVLVHSDTLSIRFRQDEKKFDVDGAYNMRYEIIKKRIDKAYIKGANERLTQPDKLAIVFTNEREKHEYIEYIEYLKSIGNLTGEYEVHNLEDLPGAYGLKALRVEIAFNHQKRNLDPNIINDLIETIQK